MPDELPEEAALKVKSTTVWVNVPLVATAKLASPPYAAVMECAPVAKVDVVNVATPPDTVPIRSVVEPSRKVTVPVGVPAPDESVAVSVMGFDSMTGLVLEVKLTRAIGVVARLLSEMLWVPRLFRLKSVNTSIAVIGPIETGSKLTGSRQVAPAAREPAGLSALTRGQADAPVIKMVKSASMLGLFPLDGTGKVRAALPMFWSVTV